MKRFKSIVATFLLCVIFLLMLLPFVSCGSRKKEVETKKEASQKEVVLEHSQSEKVASKSDSKTEETLKESEKEETIEYDGCQGDTLRVIKKGPQGLLISETIITGKGKARLHSKDKNANKNSTAHHEIKKESESKGSLKLNEQENKELSGKKVLVEQSGLSFWCWFWLILLIIIVIILVYLNYRFKFVARVTSLFANK
jgi:flagellar biosynthesis/type III secretory pathway M-ring protein FliF/YscJ